MSDNAIKLLITIVSLVIALIGLCNKDNIGRHFHRHHIDTESKEYKTMISETHAGLRREAK